MRLQTGNWRVNDLVEPLRLGLIGSGEKEAKEAGPLVTSLMEQHRLIDFRFAALALMGHALYGPEDDPLGEDEGVETPAPESGGSAPSTETELQSDGAPSKSTE